MWGRSLTLLIGMSIQLSQHHFFKGIFFLHWIVFGVLVKNQLNINVRLFWILNSVPLIYICVSLVSHSLDCCFELWGVSSNFVLFQYCFGYLSVYAKTLAGILVGLHWICRSFSRSITILLLTFLIYEYYMSFHLGLL